MADDDKHGSLSLTSLTLTALGVGTLISLIAGVIAGLIIGDMARGIGQVGSVTLSVTAVAIVLLVLLRRRT